MFFLNLLAQEAKRRTGASLATEGFSEWRRQLEKPRPTAQANSLARHADGAA
jgi:hypothetical protein